MWSIESITPYQRKVTLFVSNVSLFFIGLGIFLAGLRVEPTQELKFLHAELGCIFTIPKHIIAFGFLTIIVSMGGIYGLWGSITFYFKYGCAIFFILSYELLIIAMYLITQKVQPLYINAEILEISGSASFSNYLRRSNVSDKRSYLIEAEDNMENIQRLHSYFECCSGFKYNSWKPLIPNYICCKKGFTIPCSLENSYEDRCDRKLLVYAWKFYRYYVIICGIAFLLQSIVLGITIVFYRIELIQNDANKRK